MKRCCRGSFRKRESISLPFSTGKWDRSGERWEPGQMWDIPQRMGKQQIFNQLRLRFQTADDKWPGCAPSNFLCPLTTFVPIRAVIRNSLRWFQKTLGFLVHILIAIRLLVASCLRTESETLLQTEKEMRACE
ncbi:hypothetical protein NPIL_176121 [Nephila pilipes]|uniref:Uncharacterized protein n=1 Tax=Nephila pilipes TaxID=299642 RepID=A0A8X6N443_NEPPI|nr:hypothetical protein NPIL_176121 [Nephila pilipes]